MGGDKYKKPASKFGTQSFIVNIVGCQLCVATGVLFSKIQLHMTHRKQKNLNKYLVHALILKHLFSFALFRVALINCQNRNFRMQLKLMFLHIMLGNACMASHAPNVKHSTWSQIMGYYCTLNITSSS